VQRRAAGRHRDRAPGAAGAGPGLEQHRAGLVGLARGGGRLAQVAAGGGHRGGGAGQPRRRRGGRCPQPGDRGAEHADQPAVPGHIRLQAVADQVQPARGLHPGQVVDSREVDVVPGLPQAGQVGGRQPEHPRMGPHVAECEVGGRRGAAAGQEAVHPGDLSRGSGQGVEVDHGLGPQTGPQRPHRCGAGRRGEPGLRRRSLRCGGRPAAVEVGTCRNLTCHRRSRQGPTGAGNRGGGGGDGGTDQGSRPDHRDRAAT